MEETIQINQMESGGLNMLQPMQNEEDDILKYLLSDSPSTDLSSPDGSPMLVLEDSASSPDASPWRTDDTFSSVPTDLPDVSIDFTSSPELLMYGSFDADYSFPLNPPLPAVFVSPVPIVPTISSIQQNITPKKASRSKKRPRVSEPPPVPSPEQPEVALPREKLLQISSQGMERYVENLSSSRALSLDDQKELKRQKRLIKNRESAQLSRERKRAYIDQLEDRIAQLVNDNNLLKNENTTLRQALSQYQTVPSLVVPKTETSVTPAKDPLTMHATKMAGLISSATTIGGNRQSNTAKAGVCLLIVLFTFGLFMNSTTGPRGTGLVLKNSLPSDSAPVPYIDRSIGYKRSILEVLDEDDDFYEEQRQIAPENQLVLSTKNQRPMIQPIKVTPAGIYKLSYSPDPARFLPDARGKTTTDENNSTYMLFLDPRPDLDNDGIPDEEQQTDLQVSTHSHLSKNVDSGRLPPMIISLVVPNHIANGSNPLFPKDKNGRFSTDSLMELTCQVVDVSITTAERSHPMDD